MSPDQLTNAMLSPQMSGLYLEGLRIPSTTDIFRFTQAYSNTCVNVLSTVVERPEGQISSVTLVSNTHPYQKGEPGERFNGKAFVVVGERQTEGDTKNPDIIVPGFESEQVHQLGEELQAELLEEGLERIGADEPDSDALRQAVIAEYDEHRQLLTNPTPGLVAKMVRMPGSRSFGRQTVASNTYLPGWEDNPLVLGLRKVAFLACSHARDQW